MADVFEDELYSWLGNRRRGANLVVVWPRQQRQTVSPVSPVPTRCRRRRSHLVSRKRSLSVLPQDTIKMAAVTTLPKEVSKIGSEVKLFGKWDTQECVLH